MAKENDPVETLTGLGPKSAAALHGIGIHTRADLERTGPIETFLKLKESDNAFKPSLNFLYALVGALEDRHWKDIAIREKQRLLIELDGYQELNSLVDPAAGKANQKLT